MCDSQAPRDGQNDLNSSDLLPTNPKEVKSSSLVPDSHEDQTLKEVAVRVASLENTIDSFTSVFAKGLSEMADERKHFSGAEDVRLKTPISKLPEVAEELFLLLQRQLKTEEDIKEIQRHFEKEMNEKTGELEKMRKEVEEMKKQLEEKEEHQSDALVVSNEPSNRQIIESSTSETTTKKDKSVSVSSENQKKDPESPVSNKVKKTFKNHANIRGCLFCYQEGHAAEYCPKHRTAEERIKLVDTRGWCHCCLKRGHIADFCRQFARTKGCRYCNERHFAAICISQYGLRALRLKKEGKEVVAKKPSTSSK